MFETLIYPSSGACDYSVELPHWSYCSWFEVCWRFVYGWVGVVSGLQASACNTDTTPTQPNRNSNTHRTNNNTTNVVIQQNSRKFLMMDILMSETCWAHKKCNKKASDIKLVFYSSTITMMHGPINIRQLVYLTHCHQYIICLKYNLPYCQQSLYYYLKGPKDEVFCYDTILLVPVLIEIQRRNSFIHYCKHTVQR